MKFEVLPNKKKRIAITLVVVGLITIVGIATFSLTRAKYQYTKSIPLIRANNISYSKSDLEIVAIKLQQDDGTYKDATEIPSAGYHLNEDISKSYCKVGDTTNKVTYTYAGGSWYIKAKNKGSKCYLSFDKGGLAITDLVQDILVANGGASVIKAKGNPDFSKTSCKSGTYNETSRTCEEDTTGMWAMEDDYGISYYFRGSVTNNYVKFGKYASNYSDSTLAGKDMYWRIIRINGDGTIRMIYDGTEYHPNGTSTSNSIVSSQKFNSSDTNNAYVGYKYSTGSKRGAGSSSNARTQIDTWYTSSGLSSYANYLADSGFCGDRTSTTTNGGIPNNTGGTGTTTTYYGAYYRLSRNRIPTLKCNTISYGTSTSYEKGNKLDVYTISTTKGNGQLQYPIGLVTADETSVAGGRYYSSSSAYNYAYYLYNGQLYWTMSPFNFEGSSSSGFAYVWRVNYDGSLLYTGVSSSYGLRPVINLDPTKINNVTIDSDGVYVVS